MLCSVRNQKSGEVKPERFSRHSSARRFGQKSKMPPFACPRQVRGRHTLGVGGIGKSRNRREQPKRRRLKTIKQSHQ
jgi:hypothetical protein